MKARKIFLISGSLFLPVLFNGAEPNLKYQITEHFIEIHIDEQNVAQLLSYLAQQGVIYTQISIEKPTLEDYFLHIAKQ
jgi:hypothetical protein